MVRSYLRLILSMYLPGSLKVTLITVLHLWRIIEEGLPPRIEIRPFRFKDISRIIFSSTHDYCTETANTAAGTGGNVSNQSFGDFIRWSSYCMFFFIGPKKCTCSKTFVLYEAAQT
jgi:hypothetical protein